MSQQRSIQAFFQKSILRFAGFGLIVLVVVSLSISFLLAREQAASDLEESARATAQAFRDRILDGDIRSVEPQLKQLLHIREGETAQILKADFSKVYKTFKDSSVEAKPCPIAGTTCFDGYFGQARIMLPISTDVNSDTPYRYLYLSKTVHLNWSFLITAFLVFAIGYFGLAMVFLRISKVASGRLGLEILHWSERLKDNPKDSAPLSSPPFEELLPLKSAIEGLNTQIEKFEKTATDKAKLLLLRGIAHDILSPVSRLQLYVATLAESLGQSENADVVSEIKESLKKITSIASQVKTLNESNISTEALELVSATNDEISNLRNAEYVGAKKIQLEFDSSCKSISANLSRTDLSRIISNLVQNATDASKAGSIVSVKIAELNDQAIISVSDQGCGIPENAKTRVFDPDFTLKPGTGTGLGLAIVKYICEQRSAQIELESKVNVGTKVSIKLPLSLGVAHV